MSAVLAPPLPYYLRRRGRPTRRLFILLLIAGLHVLALAALLIARELPPAPKPLPTLMVSLISASPPPPPPQAKRKPEPKMIATPAPTPAAIQAPPIEENPAVDPPPAPPPAVAEPAPVIPPNFVAAYLNNPAPMYPAMSIRLREEGTVMLLVLVSAAGSAEQVQVEQSSGFARLDDAAAEVVKRRWRFVPARQGEQAVAAWVRIPLSFELKKH